MLDKCCNYINAVCHIKGNGTFPLMHCHHVITENLRDASHESFDL